MNLHIKFLMKKLVLLILILLSVLKDGVALFSGNITLIKAGHADLAVKTRNCNSGIIFSKSDTFDCICLVGIWVFYSKFCEAPSMMVGGVGYCFRSNTFKLRQAAIIGDYAHPFATSISHFNDISFAQLTTFITAREPTREILLDALGGWVTVTNRPWTLFNENNETVCLQPTWPAVELRRIFCQFDTGFRKALSTNRTTWQMVTKVKVGCHSNWTVKADACFFIQKFNGRKGCATLPHLKECPDMDPNTINGNATNSSASDLLKNTTIHPECYGGNTTGKVLVIDDKGVYFPHPRSKNKTDLKNETVTPPPTKEMCEGLNRKAVMDHWLDPSNNECARTIGEAVFTDQLRRFAVTRFNKAFDSRLQSLEQMNSLLEHSKDILKKTCGNDYVPSEFLDVAAEAFFMFVQEDFFYGAQGIDIDTFGRIIKSLKKCWKRAKLFIFETEPLGCDLKKINKTLILPEKTVNITVPPNGKSSHFETLIETAWKIFLNAHSYCYEDFLVNDHHHFSVQFLELFSRTIYERWTEPLANKALYKFILPYYSFTKEIMENIEICVAAAEYVAGCPVWLHRSSPTSKNNKLRYKRSTWNAEGENARNGATIGNGRAYCLQRMDEPASTLHIAACKQIY